MLATDQDAQGLQNQYSIKKPLKQNSVKKYLNKALVSVIVILFFISVVYRIIQQRKIAEKQAFYRLELQDRVKLQQPRPKNPQVLLWKIQKINQSKDGKTKGQQDSACAFINAGNIVTKITKNTIRNLLSSDSFGIVYVLTDYADRRQIQSLYNSGPFKMTQIIPKFDSDFAFMRDIAQQCRKLAYLFGNYQIMVRQIQKQIIHLQSDTLYFTSSMMKDDQVTNLPDLLSLDLKAMNHTLLYSYFYIFDTRYLQIIAPTNFIYYGKYTIEEIILLPILILYQSAGKMSTSRTLMHSFSLSFIQFKQLPVQSPVKQENAVCFISYPSDLYNISTDNAMEHIKTIENLDKQQQRITILVYLPYNFGNNQQIFEVAQYLATHSQSYARVRLRIVAKKTYPSYIVYDGVYSYCPSKSLIVSGRHNVKFHKQMLTSVMRQLSQKYHYYVFDLNSTFKIQSQPSKQYGDNLLEDKLLYTQVFKSDLFKMIPFWTLKSAELEFYQTQTPFVRHMMHINNYTYGDIPKVLATVQSRSVTQTQKNQIKYIKSYTAHLPIQINILTPYNYNSLFNTALRRNAPQKISRLIHQIWVGKSENNQLRKALFKSLVKANPGFQIMEWGTQNLTKQNFPITLHYVQMILQKHKYWNKSIYTMAADLMRYEVLVQHGGIYLDYKFQGRKPLDNFLKYQLFFQDLDISTIRLGSPKAVGNGIIGATKNNYHLKILLHQLLKQNSINFQKELPLVTGSFVLRRSFTNYQLFTNVIFGYHFFIPRPYEAIQDFCGGVNRNFGPKQKVFTIYTGKTQKPMKIAFPCDLYPQSYVILYSPIGGTWLRQKKIEN